MASDSQEQAQESTENSADAKSAPVKKIAVPHQRPVLSQVLSALGILLLEMIIPAFAAGGVLIWLFGNYNFWQIGRSTALVIFAIVMVVAALLFAVVLDTLTAPYRNSKRMKPVGFF